MRIIGLDIHRALAEAVAWDDGKLKRLGRVGSRWFCQSKGAPARLSMSARNGARPRLIQGALSPFIAARSGPIDGPAG